MMIPAQGYGGKCGKYIKITGVSLRSLGAAQGKTWALLFSQYS